MALLIAFGSAYHSRPNGSASEIRSTPRLSLRVADFVNVNGGTHEFHCKRQPLLLRGERHSEDRHCQTRLLNMPRELGNDQRDCAISCRDWRGCVVVLSGSADSAEHALPAIGRC